MTGHYNISLKQLGKFIKCTSECEIVSVCMTARAPDRSGWYVLQKYCGFEENPFNVFGFQYASLSSLKLPGTFHTWHFKEYDSQFVWPCDVWFTWQIILQNYCSCNINHLALVEIRLKFVISSMRLASPVLQHCVVYLFLTFFCFTMMK